jgi:hypothetical protein
MGVAASSSEEAKGGGSFFMCWEDFYMHFDRIYLCKLPPSSRGGLRGGGAGEVTVSGQWSVSGGSAGGCLDHSSSVTNPQFRLTVAALRLD